MHIVKPAPETRALDRAKWHKPLVSIIVTHHNYSAHLEDCLRSILDQSHDNWECVVVDDGSDDTHRAIADLTTGRMDDPRFRFVAIDNVGQIPAFFAGLDQTQGEFVCPLDPDDRYAQDFLSLMVAAHLNPVRYVPLISCEQMLMRGDALITGVQTGHASRALLAAEEMVVGPAVSELRYFAPVDEKWHWSSTSGMMLRRPALKAIRPHRPLGYRRQLDAWLAPGAHMLGGSMFLSTPLIYRGVHDGNGWLREDVWGQTQGAKLPPMGAQIRADVREAIIANGYEGDLARAKQGKRNLPQRLRRSLAKRWQRWQRWMRAEA